MPIDGRTARSQRTRSAIVAACIELVEEGDLRPTAPRVAERAGVSVRSVFQHFDDLEGLFAAVGDRVLERLLGLVLHVDPTLDFERRLPIVVRQRTALLEARPSLSPLAVRVVTQYSAAAVPGADVLSAGVGALNLASAAQTSMPISAHRDHGSGASSASTASSGRPSTSSSSRKSPPSGVRSMSYSPMMFGWRIRASA